MRKLHLAMVVLLACPAYYVHARCEFKYTGLNDDEGHPIIHDDYYDILFDVNNASDKWMYLWMGHPNHGEDNGNLNLKPHSSARAIGCSNGAGYAVEGIILTQGKDVLYTFDANRPLYSAGWVKMHTWKGGCYVALGEKYPVHNGVIQWDMSKMASEQGWSTLAARVRIDCI